jgi:hypothetical protein
MLYQVIIETDLYGLCLFYVRKYQLGNNATYRGSDIQKMGSNLH